MLLGVAVLGAAIVWAGVRDRRVLVVALAFTVVTNASNVVETEYGVQGYLLPFALLVVALTIWDRITLLPRWADRHGATSPGHAALVGTALLLTAVFSAMLGPFVSDAPTASSFYVGVLVKDLLVVAAVALAVVDRSTFRAALAGLTLGGAVLAAITVAQMTLGMQGNPMGGFGRWTTQEVAGLGETARAAGPFLNDPNSYAQHLAVAFGAAVGLAITSGRTAVRVWTVVGAALIVGAMVGTSSRTGFLAIAVVAALALWSERPTPAQLGAVGVVVAVAVLGPFGIGGRLATLGDVGSVGTGAADTSLTGRAGEALAALHMFADRPLTGVGYGAYPAEYLDVARRIGYETRFEERSAHSLPLEIAAEQGLIGVASWAALAVFVGWVVIRLRRRHRAEGLSFGLALVGFAATAVFLHDVHPRVMWLLLALAVAGARLVDRDVGRLPLPSRVDRRPVVAMVIQNYVPALGGAERQLASLAPRLGARGVRPVVITRAHPGRPMRDEVDGVPVVRIPVTGPKPLRSLLFVVGARAELRSLRPDVVHAFDTLSPSVIALGHRRRHGTPVAVKLLRSGESGDLAVLHRKRFGSRRVRSLVAEVDRFVAISTDLTGELWALGVPDDRIVHIPNGVDADRFRPVETCVDRAEHRVIATGRLAPEKRLDAIARRWPAVRSRHPAAELLIVGDGPERAALDGYPGVRLLGRREDVSGELRSAGIYVSASNAEGLSNSLLEAMASGLACVVTDVGGVRDVVVDGVHGIIVDPDDLDGLVDRIAELLDSGERRRALGRAARERVVEGWSLDATAAALTELYHELSRGAPQVVSSTSAVSPERSSPRVCAPAMVTP
jgi:glycosyltransferase involved in cell wall biosynthesis/O-antigen ligase